jgi:hypothetical protein
MPVESSSNALDKRRAIFAPKLYYFHPLVAGPAPNAPQQPLRCVRPHAREKSLKNFRRRRSVLTTGLDALGCRRAQRDLIQSVWPGWQRTLFVPTSSGSDVIDPLCRYNAISPVGLLNPRALPG